MPRVLALALLLSGAAHAATLDTITTCHTVERRRPVDERGAFSFADGQMYVWLRVRDADEVELRWYRDGRTIVSDRLKPTSRDWRTWMRRRFRPGDDGAWRIEVLSGKTLLGEVEFTVSPGDTVEAAPPRVTRAPAPEPVAEPEPPPAPAPVAIPTQPEPDWQDGCRAALNVRTSPLDAPAAYAVADVRFGAIAAIDHGPGLIIDDGRDLHALTVRRRQQGPRAWDEVMSRPLRGDAPIRRWRNLPGTQPLPAPGQLREDNALTIVSILGPYLGMHARLKGEMNGTPFNNSRFLTADAKGALIDLRQVVGAGLEIMVGRLVDGERFDYRRIALMPDKGLTARFENKHVPMFSPPPAVRPFSPDAEGVHRRGRCAIKLAGHRVAASYDGAPFREVRAPGLLPYALLGVIWLDPKGPDVIVPLERARQRFARLP